MCSPLNVVLMSHILVAGASGLIGGHLVKRLLRDGHRVRAVGRRPVGQWPQRHPDAENIQLDLSEKAGARRAVEGVEQVYNLAADIGGVNFIEKNKALCMLSVLVNTHLLMASRGLGVKRYLYTSSFAVAAADSRPASALEDGHIWEKLFSERLCRHFREDFGLETRVARLQNVYGTHDRIRGERVRAPVALSVKAIEAKRRGSNRIEIWGDGTQVRSFLSAEDCADGLAMLMASGITDPVRVGSNEFVSVNQLVDAVERAAGVKFERAYNLQAPRGIERKPDAMAIDPRLGWQPRISLQEGIGRLYSWVERELIREA